MRHRLLVWIFWSVSFAMFAAALAFAVR